MPKKIEPVDLCYPGPGWRVLLLLPPGTAGRMANRFTLTTPAQIRIPPQGEFCARLVSAVEKKPNKQKQLNAKQQ